MQRLSVLSCALVASVSFAQQPIRAPTPARWDDSFGTPGLESSAAALALFDDGSGTKLHVGGGFDVAGNLPTDDLACWTGTRWQGVPVPSHTPIAGNGLFDLCVFDDGTGPRLFVACRYEMGSDIVGVMAWDGTSWETFAIEGLSPTAPTSVTSLLSDGSSLYAAGRFNQIDGVSVQNVARYDSSGWHPMGLGASAGVWVAQALAFSDAQGPNRLYVGLVDFAGGETLRWWDGVSWIAVPGLTESVRALAHHAGPGGAELVVSADDELLSLTGAGFAPFSSGAPTVVLSLLSRPENGVPILYAGGSFLTAGGVTVNHVTRWNGTSWQALGAPTPGVEGQYVADLLFADLGLGEQLFVTGSFGSAGGAVATGVAAWRGESWRALGSGEAVFHQTLTLDTFDFAVFDDGDGSRLYIAGEFFAGAARVPNFARWEDDHWAPVPGNPFSLSDDLHEMHVWDDGTGSALYVGGKFTALGSRSIVRWNGDTWSGLGSGVSGFVGGQQPEVRAIEGFDDGSGPELWVGGAFTDAGGVAVTHLARWDGSSWLAAGDPNSGVAALEAWDDGSGEKLFVAGSFTEIGGVPVSEIAAWDGSTWSDLDGGVVGGASGLHAVDLPAIGGGQLLVFGSLTQAGNASVSGGLARWTGQAWGTDLGLSGFRTDAVAAWDDGTGSKLYAATAPPAGGTLLHLLEPSGWKAIGLRTVGRIHRLLAYESGPLGPSLWTVADGDLRHRSTVSFGVARLHRSAGPWSFVQPVGAPPAGQESLLGSYDSESDEVILRVGASGRTRAGVLFLGTDLGPSRSGGPPGLSVAGILSAQPFDLGPSAEPEIRFRLPTGIVGARIYAQAVLLDPWPSATVPFPIFSDVLRIERAGPAREK